MAHLRAAIARDPSYDSAWLGLARALFQISISTSSTVLTNEQRHALADQSFAALSTALTLNPALALAHYQLGFQLLTIGRATDAAKALHEADRFVATDITMSASEKTNTQALIRSALDLARSRAR